MNIQEHLVEQAFAKVYKRDAIKCDWTDRAK